MYILIGTLCGECVNSSSVTALFSQCSNCTDSRSVLIPALSKLNKHYVKNISKFKKRRLQYSMCRGYIKYNSPTLLTVVVDVVVFAVLIALNIPLPEWSYPFIFYIQVAHRPLRVYVVKSL